MTSKPTAFLLDIYETLLTCDFNYDRTVLPLLAEVDVDAWNHNSAFLAPSVTVGRVTMAEAFEVTVRACGGIPEPDLIQELVRKDAELLIASTRVHGDTLPLLHRLQYEGIAVALVSNCGENTRPLLAELGLIDLVDAVILSCEIGAAKPSPEIYWRALQEVDVSVERAVFVDDQATYCAGASELGMRTLQIDRKAPVHPHQPNVIRSLHELIDML
jgi:putative hydrolase of the HAD superfamily